MNAGQAKDVGKIKENSLQNLGNAVTGHEKPVRNITIGDRKSSVTSTVSLLLKNELQNVAKKTQDVTKNSSRIMMLMKSPLCGNLNKAGTMQAIYMPIIIKNSQ